MAAPKPPLAAWITTERDRKGWKVEELSRRLVDLGCDAAVNTVRVWEAPRGRPPKASTVAMMEQLFGSEAPAQDVESDLAAAIREQAVAIDRLAQALETQRKDIPLWADAVVKAVLAGRQLTREDVERDEPPGSGALPQGQST